MLKCITVSEFDSLSRERHTFTSDKEQELTGYLYQNGEIPKKGLLIFAHGYGGGGHERYMALLNAWGEDMAGPAARLVTPFMSLYEYLRFGRYHTLSATQAFRECDTKIIIVHSADDDTVPFRSGYGLWEPECESLPYDSHAEEEKERFEELTYTNYTGDGGVCN